MLGGSGGVGPSWRVLKERGFSCFFFEGFLFFFFERFLGRGFFEGFGGFFGRSVSEGLYTLSFFGLKGIYHLMVYWGQAKLCTCHVLKASSFFS